MASQEKADLLKTIKELEDNISGLQNDEAEMIGTYQKAREDLDVQLSAVQEKTIQVDERRAIAAADPKILEKIADPKFLEKIAEMTSDKDIEVIKKAIEAAERIAKRKNNPEVRQDYEALVKNFGDLLKDIDDNIASNKIVSDFIKGEGGKYGEDWDERMGLKKT